MKFLLLLTMFNFSAQAKSEQKSEQKKIKESKVIKKDGEICELPKSDSELRKLLSPEQYKVMKENGTERPFDNRYHNNKHPGIYVDLISKEALFSSKDKFDSGTGWPSFTRPIRDQRVVEKKDATHGMVRVEVRSKKSDSHLGHVFDDGPGENGLRFCINSASLNFVPLEKMEELGYEKYLDLFDKKDWEKANKEPYK